MIAGVCIVVQGAAAGGPAASLPVVSANEHAVRPSEPYEPIKRIRQLIRLLYKLMGGDPNELTDSLSLESTFLQFNSYYALHGPITGLTSLEQLAGRVWIEETYMLALLLAPQLEPTAVESFLDTLELLYADFGGDPGNLGRTSSMVVAGP